MISKTDAIDAIFKILTEMYAIKSRDITKTTRINKDLGIEGDDAVELIEFLEDHFHISLNIDLRSYFLGEGIFDRKKTADLTIEELAKFVSDS